MSQVIISCCKVGNRSSNNPSTIGEGLQVLRSEHAGGAETLTSSTSVQPTATLVAPSANYLLHVWRVVNVGTDAIVWGVGPQPANLAAAIAAGHVVLPNTSVPFGVTNAGEQPWIINLVP